MLQMETLFPIDLNGHPLVAYRSSGVKTESAAIHAGPAVMGHLVVFTDGTNDATVTVFDNATAASGTVLFKAVVPAADRTGGGLSLQVRANAGLYLQVTGTGATALMHYLA
jgi:hypothetical protein